MRCTFWNASRVIVLVVGLLPTTACPGNGPGQLSADASTRPDASPPLVPDASLPDAAPPGPAVRGAALVPAGATSRSAGYRFVGTLTPGNTAAAPQNNVRTGGAGAAP
jgi:hypothetical protein